jgi:para-nitrobenzyl esterase
MAASERETPSGRVQGVDQDGVWIGRGIPFADGPTGAKRFRRVGLAKPWTRVFDASRVGSILPQNPSLFERMQQAHRRVVDEAALTADVWAPAGATDAPVMVWFHGGGFTNGSPSMPWYDGANLARHFGIVVVGVSYRLGALGGSMLGHLNDDELYSGNVAMYDRVLALQWVQSHIESYGGNPSKVTVVGESAGAMGIGALLAVEEVHGLFRFAILQSGSASQVRSPYDARAVTASLLARLGLPEEASAIAALRSIPVPALLKAQRNMIRSADVGPLAFRPVVDGELLNREPLHALALMGPLPFGVVVGTNADELKPMVLGDVQASGLTDRLVTERVTNEIGDAERAQEIVRAYREIDNTRSTIDMWADITSDHMFHRPAEALREVLANNHTGVWSYLFDWRSTALGGSLGAFHALEVPFLFGNHTAVGVDRLAGNTPDVPKLSAVMSSIWAQMVIDGRPPDWWGQWTPVNKETAMLSVDVGLKGDPFANRRDTWSLLKKL